MRSANIPYRRRPFASCVCASAAATIVLALVPSLGCGDGDPFDYILVEGKLAYEDGRPLPAAGIRLFFYPVDAQPQGEIYPRPAAADVGADGAFQCATSVQYGDGLVPGKHKVAIYYAVDAQGKSLIPGQYAHGATTPLVIDTANVPLEIKVPRP